MGVRPLAQWVLFRSTDPQIPTSNTAGTFVFMNSDTPPPPKLNSFSSFSLRMHSRIKYLKEYRSLGLHEKFVIPKVCRTLIKQHLYVYLSFTEGYGSGPCFNSDFFPSQGLFCLSKHRIIMISACLNIDVTLVYSAQMSRVPIFGNE